MKGAASDRPSGQECPWAGRLLGGRPGVLAWAIAGIWGHTVQGHPSCFITRIWLRRPHPATVCQDWVRRLTVELLPHLDPGYRK